MPLPHGNVLSLFVSFRYAIWTIDAYNRQLNFKLICTTRRTAPPLSIAIMRPYRFLFIVILTRDIDIASLSVRPLRSCIL